jgi:predicted unusual protein kinase regulating ubiquinone biosynthesis (AarF/ABC1/UbiB family)
MYDVIFEAVESMGGVYVKLLQFLSLRVGLIPDSAKLRFLTFYDQVKVDPLNVRAILTKELGSEKLQNFQEIDPTPFASGTFGQVYKGKLTDGKEVIIKVKRPNVHKGLKTDFTIIRALGFLFDLLFEQHIVVVQNLISEFKDITYRELDYRAEVTNALYLYDHYRSHPVLRIPYTYRDLSTDTVIVQEYIGGVAITDLLRMRSKGQDIQAWLAKTYNTDLHYIMTRFSYDCLWQIFTMDKFYSDPHPGNIKILPNNTYAFIDFGIMEPSPTNRRDYFRIIKFLSAGAVSLNAEGLGEQLIAIGAPFLYQSMHTYDRILAENEESLVKTVLSRYGELIDGWKEQFQELEQGQKENYTQVWLDLFRMGERFNMRLPKGVFAGLRASALITSFCKYLDPTHKTMKRVYQNITNDVNEKELLNIQDPAAEKINLERAIETVGDWFAGLAEADLMLYRDVTRLRV